MFKILFTVFIVTVFAKISVEGLICKVKYLGFLGNDIPSYANITQKCGPSIASCISVDGTIQEKSFSASDCDNTVAAVLTNYFQGQYSYKNEFSFNCDGINPDVSYNDGTLAYTYHCSTRTQDSPSTTFLPTSTEKGDASTLSCIISTIFLSIIYTVFN